MTQEHLFASFMLDKTAGLEIALRAENVTEATPITGPIQALPASIDFLEGIMHLRNDVIPVINLKKRLGLTEHSYDACAKVAVVKLFNTRCGLLFDDIREVFRVEAAQIKPIDSVLQSDDKIISALISLEQGQRTVEVLELKNLFKGGLPDMTQADALNEESARDAEPIAYSRYVVFTCAQQEYGIPVQYSQEISFFADIDELFKSGCVEGALPLRGKKVPVIRSHYLLSGNSPAPPKTAESARILILSSENCTLGMIVDEVKEIVTVPDREILPMPPGGSSMVSGIYPRRGNGDIMLLDMPKLVGDHMETIKSLFRINGKKETGKEDRLSQIHSHHLITENCYLVFAIDKHFGIEIKDVQEIIESDGMMDIPGATGFFSQVINLRGRIVPVVSLRKFYNYPPKKRDEEKTKLIICAGRAHTVALEVDRIVTIYKQEQFHPTPSLNAQLAGRKDTLDRLIDFIGHEGISEHVLVVNVDNLVSNHLQMPSDDTRQPAADEKGVESSKVYEKAR